jgi:hypothetical protein
MATASLTVPDPPDFACITRDRVAGYRMVERDLHPVLDAGTEKMLVVGLQGKGSGSAEKVQVGQGVGSLRRENQELKAPHERALIIWLSLLSVKLKSSTSESEE